MANTNDFLPFAVGLGANVLSQADYAALTPALANGFQAGTAISAQLNKVWRQSSIMSAVLAQFIVDNSGQSAVDDGTIVTLKNNLIAAVQQVSIGRLLRISVYSRVAGIQNVSVNGGVNTTSGATTFIALSDTKGVDIECLGAGGAGGGAGGTGSGVVQVGNPGSAGGYARGYYTSSFASLAIVVGQAGTSVSNGNGNSGGSSSVGALISSPGGNGGVRSPQGSPPQSGGTISSGMPTGGNVISAPGTGGSPSAGLSDAVGWGGSGGSSVFGAGGSPSAIGNNGSPGGVGAGGSGVMIGGNNSGSFSGGKGGDGLIIIREYA